MATADEKLIVATDTAFVPFEFKEGDKYVGFDIDIWDAIATELNVEFELRPMDFNGIVPALQTNQVDAQENPLPTIEAMRFYEVQDYVAITNHFIASIAMMISNDLWQSLSEEEQGWIMEAVEAGAEVNDSRTVAAEEELLATFEERGLTITRPDLEPFRAAMQPYYDTLEAEYGEGAIDRVRGE